jgi:hypothetical protein
MSNWKPITLLQLYDQIYKGETHLDGEALNFWQLIKLIRLNGRKKIMAKKAAGFG